jgi:hypothetical protein
MKRIMLMFGLLMACVSVSGCVVEAPGYWHPHGYYR